MTFAKYIDCTVAPNGTDRFSLGQNLWAAMTPAVDGFAAQFGGWSGDNRAYTLSLWDTECNYGRFMGGTHDGIADRADQSGVIDTLDIATGVVCFPIGAPLGSPTEATRAEILRVADCTVFPDRAGHFVGVQHDVWNPTMAAAPGMAGGVFVALRAHRYLVATLWASAEEHDHYARSSVPELRQRADVETDVESISDMIVGLEGRWAATGTAFTHLAS